MDFHRFQVCTDYSAFCAPASSCVVFSTYNRCAPSTFAECFTPQSLSCGFHLSKVFVAHYAGFRDTLLVLTYRCPFYCVCAPRPPRFLFSSWLLSRRQDSSGRDLLTGGVPLCPLYHCFHGSAQRWEYLARVGRSPPYYGSYHGHENVFGGWLSCHV